MAAFTGTPTAADTYTSQTGGSFANSLDSGSRLQIATFSYTHTATAGTGTGEVNLVTLPAGRLKIFPDLSRIVTSQFEANADLHLGYRAHTDQAGATVAAVANAFLDNADAGGGALDSAWTLPAAGITSLNSRDGITIYAMIDTGDIAATDTISGWVAFTHEG